MESSKILKHFIEKLELINNEIEAFQLINEIESYLSNNPAEHNLKVLLANLYLSISNEKEKVFNLLKNINIESLEEDVKVAYLIMLFNLGDFEKLLKSLEGLEKGKWKIYKKENLVTIKLLYILIAGEYLKFPLIEEEIKDIYRIIFKEEFRLDKFVENFNLFLSTITEISRLDNIEYLLYEVYLYLKAKLKLKEIYKQALEVIEDILSDISSKYLAYFSLSTDEKNLILFVVIDDLFFESMEEFLEFRANTESEIKEKIKRNFNSFPDFTIVFPNPIIEEIKENDF